MSLECFKRLLILVSITCMSGSNYTFVLDAFLIGGMRETFVGNKLTLGCLVNHVLVLGRFPKSPHHCALVMSLGLPVRLF